MTRDFESGDSPVRVGRGDSDHFRLSSGTVSRSHLVFTHAHCQWRATDSTSSNGTYDEHGIRLHEVDVVDRVVFRMGHPDDGELLEVRVLGEDCGDEIAEIGSQGAATVMVSPANLRLLANVEGHNRTINVGRSDDNDISVDDLSVSRRHATIRSKSAGIWVVEDHSANGTVVDGIWLRGSTAEVGDGSSIQFGHHAFTWRGGVLVSVGERVGVAVDFSSVSVRTTAGQTVLDQINFHAEPATLLGVLGPSGSGKSTLVRALIGSQTVTEGNVLLDNRSLRENLNEFRDRIGYVPQDDLLHPQLTVRQALTFVGRLRFSADVSEEEIRKAVDRTVHDLGLTDRIDVVISSLSGGQRKRVSIGMEILTKPSLLVLDEPTSGLDPGYELQVMQLLRELADQGFTVVVVTHAMANIDLCDQVLVLAKGGRRSFLGKPTERISAYGTENWANLFIALEHDFEPMDHTRTSLSVGSPTSGRSTLRKKRRSGPRQFVTLTQRYVAVTIADKRSVALLVAQAPVVSLLLMLMSRNGLRVFLDIPNPKAILTVLGLVLAITYLGAANAVREVVKEIPIFRRERSYGLSVGAYLASKIAVLATIIVLQSVLVVLIGTALSGHPASGSLPVLTTVQFDLIIAVSLTGIAAMCVGLLISSLVSTQEKAMTVLPVVLLAMYFLSGGPSDPTNTPILAQLSSVNPARWGLASAGSAVDLRALNHCSSAGAAALYQPATSNRTLNLAANELDDHCKSDWASNSRRFLVSIAVLGLLSAILIGGANLALRFRGTR